MMGINDKNILEHHCETFKRISYNLFAHTEHEVFNADGMRGRSNYDWIEKELDIPTDQVPYDRFNRKRVIFEIGFDQYIGYPQKIYKEKGTDRIKIDVITEDKEKYTIDSMAIHGVYPKNKNFN